MKRSMVLAALALVAFAACDRGNYTSAGDYAASHPTAATQPTPIATTNTPTPTVEPTTEPPTQSISAVPPTTDSTTTPPSDDTTAVPDAERASFFCTTADGYIAGWMSTSSLEDFQSLRAWVDPAVVDRIPDGGANDAVKTTATALSGDLADIWTKILEDGADADLSAPAARAAGDTLLLVAACKDVGVPMSRTRAALAANPSPTPSRHI